MKQTKKQLRLVPAKGLETPIVKALKRKKRRHKYKLKIWHIFGYVSFCIECGQMKTSRRKVTLL